MPYDEKLAARVRPLLAEVSGAVEKKMFGGVAFLVHGHMSVGVHKDALIVRIDPAQGEAALAEPGTRPFDITGRPMKGWLMVTPEALATPKALAAWVRRGVSFAQSLPPK